MGCGLVHVASFIDHVIIWIYRVQHGYSKKMSIFWVLWIVDLGPFGLKLLILFQFQFETSKIWYVKIIPYVSCIAIKKKYCFNLKTCVFTLCTKLIKYVHVSYEKQTNKQTNTNKQTTLKYTYLVPKKLMFNQPTRYTAIYILYLYIFSIYEL